MGKVGWITFRNVFGEYISNLGQKLTSFFKIIIYQFTKFFKSKELHDLIISREKLKEEYFETSPMKHLMLEKYCYLALLQLTLNEEILNTSY